MEATTAERYATGGPGVEPAVPRSWRAFHETVDRLGRRRSRSSRRGGHVSWNELRAQARAVAGGLASLGVGKGDTVAIMLNNRPEFFPIDLGVVTLGARPVLDLPDLLAGADRLRRLRRRRQGRDRREVLPRDLREGRGAARLEHLIVLDGEGGTMSSTS